MGACGCGTGDQAPFSWQWNDYTAAAGPSIFGSATWCGTGCGKCYKLTPTNGYSPTGGQGAPNNNSIVVMVTNLCPPSGNEQWCPSGTNSYGYGAHFDLMDHNMNGKISQLGWNNPEVTYQQVSCGSGGSPSSSDYSQCKCK
eukprot:TRINITY_DN3726_c0_g1_i1.p1 TRINITY_DN3726_c0_g1~~TRINITY_DN3726_c0_g1_i1.p1  ORF type:complete len:142 (-),score=29.35 TRINITY_DN3726_c0_g1_i1:95-520(-)